MTPIRALVLSLTLLAPATALADAADDSYGGDDSDSGSSGGSGGSGGSGSSGSSGGSSGSGGSGGSSGGDDTASDEDDKSCGCAAGGLSPISALSVTAGLVALAVAARRS